MMPTLSRTKIHLALVAMLSLSACAVIEPNPMSKQTLAFKQLDVSHIDMLPKLMAQAG